VNQEAIDSNSVDGTVQCIHCKNWQGSARPLNRKKEHLLKCPAYAAWRAAGNGQEIPPPNPYSKRVSLDDVQSSPFGNDVGYGPQFTPTMARNTLGDLSQYFDEIWDDSQKSMRVRCKYCGEQRSKNSPRQFDHLQRCNDFHNTTEGEQALASGSLNSLQAPSTAPLRPKPDMLLGTAPNPNFPRPSKAAARNSSAQTKGNAARQGAPKPSLINYLLTKLRTQLSAATQRQFLSLAGSGTVPAAAVETFLLQQNAISRAMPGFIGKIIGKIRLPAVDYPQSDTDWRAFDLLASTINNAKRELEFLRTTKDKYGLAFSISEPPRPATKSLVGLMQDACSPEASLLEGMMVLWALEYLHHESWHYAATFINNAAPTSTSYTLPTYYQHNGTSSSTNPFAPNSQTNGVSSSHTAAVMEALIPNWTSAGFGKFVDACKAIVDELANAQTTGNGAKELANAEQVFAHMCWIWGQIWPEIAPPEPEKDDEGEENGDGVGPGTEGEPIDVEDDEGDQDANGDDEGMEEEDEEGIFVEHPSGGMASTFGGTA
jgi:hypothetical protein